MNISERITAAKPVIGGAVLGAVVAIAVGFGAGWVVTAGTMQDEVAKAQIDAFAQICEQDAAAHWQEQGKDLAALDGWRNEERIALAKRFAANLNADKTLQDAIQDRCEDLLQPA